MAHNRILQDEHTRAAFIDWAADHHKHFDCYPGSFIMPDPNGADIDYTESEVWQACEILISEGAL